MIEKKQPWNPFPLAALSAADKFDLSPCATQIIHYLAARSNHTGWTCVGQDRVAHDLRRCRDYVTKGFQELRDKKVIDTRSRGRKLKQGDWCLLAQELLPVEWRKCNPAEQEDISECNPVCGNEILPSRTKPYSINLAESQTHNLAVSEPKSQKQVSELVSEDSSVAALPRAVAEHEQPLDHENRPPQYSKRLGRMFDDGEWDIVMDLYQTLLPNDTEAKIRGFDDKELLALAEVDWDIQHRYSSRAMGSINRATGEMQTGEHVKVVTAQDFWHWNHTHKTGKLKFLTMADMAKAWWSTDPRCGRVQWENDDPDTCPVCTRLRSKAKQDNSKCMDEPPVSPTPRESAAEAEEAALDPELCRQCQNHPRKSEQGYCEFCFMNLRRYEHGDSIPGFAICPHGYAPPDDCPTCNPKPAKPDAECGECKAGFWSDGGRNGRFCSDKCKDDHNKKLAAIYAKPSPAPFNGLAAFLEGEP